MMPNWKTLHNDFKFDGLSYSKEELKELAYSFVKEGAQHEQAIGSFLQAWLDDNVAIKVTSSGSTGKPKEISLKKEHMVNSALATGAFFELKASDAALLCLSADFIAGKMMLVRAMILGIELDYVEPSSFPLEGISKEYDFCAMVPMQVENSLKEIARIKTLIVGGASISNTLRDKLQSDSCDVFETYGMTESITHVAVKDVRLRAVEAQVKNYFIALPHVHFSIDNRDCLVIDAPKISDDKVVTNDMVNLISGTEFEWLGRYDNVINSGGVKLFPEQIESKLETLIPNRFFVAGLPDEKLGQKLVVIIEGEMDIEQLSQKMAALSSLGKYETPKEIYLLPELLETETGKIRRKSTTKLILS